MYSRRGKIGSVSPYNPVLKLLICTGDTKFFPRVIWMYELIDSRQTYRHPSYNDKEQHCMRKVQEVPLYFRQRL